jgi:hypothetical protein
MYSSLYSLGSDESILSYMSMILICKVLECVECIICEQLWNLFAGMLLRYIPEAVYRYPAAGIERYNCSNPAFQHMALIQAPGVTVRNMTLDRMVLLGAVFGATILFDLFMHRYRSCRFIVSLYFSRSLF